MGDVDAAFKAKLERAVRAAGAAGPFPDELPANTDLAQKPGVVYFASDERQLGRTLGGGSGGLPRRVYQVDIFSANAATSRALTRKAEKSIREEFDPDTDDGSRGMWIYGTGGVFVQGCTVEDNHDDYVPPEFADDVPVRVVSLNVVVIFDR